MTGAGGMQFGVLVLMVFWILFGVLLGVLVTGVGAGALWGGGADVLVGVCVAIWGLRGCFFFLRGESRTGFQGILNTQALSSSQILVLQRRSSSASCQN